MTACTEASCGGLSGVQFLLAFVLTVAIGGGVGLVAWLAAKEHL